MPPGERGRLDPRLARNLLPVPLSGEYLKFYVRRRIDDDFEEYVKEPRTFAFVEAAPGFGKTSSINYWAANVIPRLGARPVRLKARAVIDVLYQPAAKILDVLAGDLAFTASAEPAKVDLIDRLSRVHDRLEAASTLSDYANVLLRLDELAADAGARFFVLMDDFKPMGLTEFNRLLEELDSLNQDPQAIFFVFFGTPRDLASVGKAHKPFYEKLAVFKMPHFTYEEAVQAIRLRVEDAGYRLEELLPQDVLTAIYAMSPGPRDLLTTVLDYLETGDLREAVRRAEERATAALIELLEPGERAIVRVIAERGTVTTSELAESLGMPRSSLYLRLQRLMEREIVVRRARGLYALSKKAKTVLGGGE